jgi:AraC-type DNA-binding domain-containing proteins
MSKNKKGIANSWLISYIAVLFIPLTITMVLFYGIEKIVSSEISDMNKSVLLYIKGNLDNMFYSVKGISLQVEMFNEVNGVIKMGNVMELEDHYMVLELNKRLREYTNYSDYIEDIIVSAYSSGYSISAKSSYAANLKDEMLRQYNLSVSDWEKINNIDKRGFYIVGDENNKRIVYVSPLSLSKRSEQIGVLITFPKEYHFEQNITSGNAGNDKGIYLAGAAGSIKSIGHEPEWINDDIINLVKTDNGDFNLNTGKVMLTGLKSDAIDMQYVIITKYSDVYSAIVAIRSFMILGISVSSLVGLLFSIYFTRRNYEPISKLVSSVGENLGLKLEHDINEYRFLTTAMMNVISNRDEFENQLNLIRLLRGGSISDKILNKLFDSRQFVVIAYAIEDTREFFNDESLVNNQHRLVSFIIQNCNKDFFEEIANFHIVELDRHLVQILYRDSQDSELVRKEILNILEDMHKFINESLKIKLSIAVGGICYNPAGLREAYVEAQDALEYRMILGNNVIIDSNQLSDCALFYDYSMEMEKDIINCLKGGSYEQTKALVFKVIDSNLASGMLSSQLAHCMLFDLVGTIIKVLSLTKLDNSFLGNLNPIERLFRCETFEQMKWELSDILYNVCEYINNNNENEPNKKLFEKLIKYMDENYMDKSLNVTILAERFSISNTFLLKIFKGNLGLTPLEYINRLRCEQSVVILITTNVTVEEVANRVGYSTVHSYIRVFKKLYGKTPGAYRDMLVSS